MPRRPLLIGTSGGAGCITAIEALADDGLRNSCWSDLPLHSAALRSDKKRDKASTEIWVGSHLMNDVPAISTTVSGLTGLMGYPVLPDAKSLSKEMDVIEKGQKDAQGQAKKRRYVDMLIDVFDAGYLYVAIYNTLHKRFNIKQARKMVDQQVAFEKSVHKHVKQFFLAKLNEASEAGTPYTEIITTQMVSLGAICDAVLEYNSQHFEQRLHIDQYMSDVFTEGAQHYFEPLSRLNKTQRSVLNLYGMNINKEIALLGDTTKMPFARIQEVDVLNNPMVRPGFKNHEHLNGFKTDHFLQIQLPIQRAGNDEEIIDIQPNEKIASIMLSSLGGNDSADYAECIAQLMDDTGKRTYDKIFVFSSGNEELKSRLIEIEQRIQGRAISLGLQPPAKLVILDKQNDVHMAPLLTRSNLAILRGGVTLMEEMSIPHTPDQKFFFHHMQNCKGQLTTGLPWEDASINYFLAHVREKHGINWAKKGTVSMLRAELSDRKLLSPTDQLVQELEAYHDRFLCNKTAADMKLDQALIDAFDKLITELKADLIAQQRQKISEKKIQKSVGYQLAQKTLHYINQLTHIVSDPNKDENIRAAEVLALAQDYDKSCYALARHSGFAKFIVLILALTCGIGLGFALGGVAGIAIGVWAGPGAVVSALAGLSSGAVTGSAIGLAASATVTGAACMVTATRSTFFKKDPTQGLTDKVPVRVVPQPT